MPQDKIDAFISRQTKQRVAEEAQRQGVDPSAMDRLINQESRYRADIITGSRRSKAGAIGPGQIMPGTARDLKIDPFDIDQNIEGSVRYYKQQSDRFKDPKLAAAAYNAGPGAVQKYKGVPPYKETQAYVRNVAPDGDKLDSFLDRQYETAPLRRPERKPVNLPPGWHAPMAPPDEAKPVRKSARPKPMEWQDGKVYDLTTNTFKDPDLQAKREQYYAQPLSAQRVDELAGGVARAGEWIQKRANRIIHPVLEAVGLGEYAERGRQAAEYTSQKLGKKEEIANRLPSKITRGAAQGATSALHMAPVAMTGGIPAVMGVTALGEDWRQDPVGSTVNTATAGLPIVAGRAISPAAQKVVSGIGNAALRKAGQVGIEALAGGAANVGQYAGTQALLGREIDPEELISQGIVGAGLSGAMSPRLNRPGRPQPLSRPTPLEVQRPATPIPTEITKLTPEVMGLAEERRLQAVARDYPNIINELTALGDQPAGSVFEKYGVTEADLVKAQGMQPVEERVPTEPLSRPLPSPLLKQRLIDEPAVPETSRMPSVPDAEPTQAIQEKPLSVSDQRREAKNKNIRTAMQDRDAARSTAEEAAARGDVGEAIRQYSAEADALRGLRSQIQPKRRGDRVQRAEAGNRLTEIQREISRLKRQARVMTKPTEIAPKPPEVQPTQRVAGDDVLENAPTADIPAVPETSRVEQPEIRPTERIAEAPALATTAELVKTPHSMQENPQREFTNRITEGEGDTLPRQPVQEMLGQPVEVPERRPARPRTERLPVPKANDANITRLRDRRDELGRLVENRRGELPQDLADEFRELGSAIKTYENQAQPVSETLSAVGRPGRAGGEEYQPTLDKRTSFKSREDARQSHFEQFNDDELVQQVRSLEDRRNKAIRGEVRLSPEEQDNLRFDLKTARDMQKERRYVQEQMGMDEASRIPVQAAARPARKINHSQFGEVTQAENQKGVPRGQLRVEDSGGKTHIIRNPRTGGGNQNAAFVKQTKAKSLAQFVKEAGGIRPSIANRGELSYASTKESKKVAIINRRGIPADEMRRRAEESGYGKWETESEFLSALRDDVEGRKVFSTEREVDYETEYKKSLSPDDQTELQSFENFLNDKDAAGAYDAVSGGDVSQNAIKQLQQFASKHGLAEDSVQAIINEGRTARQEAPPEILQDDARSQSETPSQKQLAKVKVDYRIPPSAAPELSKPTGKRGIKRFLADEGGSADIDLGLSNISKYVLRGLRKAAGKGFDTGAPVQMGKARDALGLEKEQFDNAVMELADKGILAPHEHDYVGSLTPDQRDNLVKVTTKDGKDRYIIGAALREKFFNFLKDEGGSAQLSLGAAAILGRLNQAQRTPPQRGQARRSAAPPPQSNTDKVLSNVGSALGLPRALMASADLSAPLRQGAILTLPPSQWGRAGKSSLRMIRALNTRQYDRLVQEMNNHPDAKAGKDSGLYMSTDDQAGASLRGREEDFISKWAGKIPIVKQSEQAYKTYLDSIRLETFRKYKRVIDGDSKLSQDERNSAYKAAADWINVASGRGSLGQTLDKAMPALSTIFFAPRYAASRMQVLNPVTYLKNSTTPAGRAVLKQQMSDLVQFGAVISATLALAHASGAEVGLDPDDADFLKIKHNNTRFDTLAGLQQFMRLFYRIGKDAGRAAQGKEADERQDAVSIAGRFARSKLAPVPSYFVDMISRKDFIGRDFDAKRGAIERAVPLMWKDMTEAVQREGIGGAAKSLPGFFGVGVQQYDRRVGAMKLSDKSGFKSEARRFGLDADFVRPLKGEPENLHKARAAKIEGWLGSAGEKLVSHPRYAKLTDEQKKAALRNLKSAISENANLRSPRTSAFEPGKIISGVLKGERNREQNADKYLYRAPR